MKVTSKTIGEVADVIAGQSPPSDLYNKTGNGLPFYQGKADFGEKYPVARTWCNGTKNKEAVQNDILLSVRAPVGPVNICQVRSVIGRGLSAIRAKKGCSFEYLFYYLKNHEREISKLGTGSTFKAITQTHINRIKLPIPESYDDQIRIATVLTRAERLIAKRKESIKALDELLKSTFLEMFGDPSKAKPTDNVKTIEDVCQFKGGGTPSKAKPEYFTGNIPWVSPKDMKSLYINTSIDKITQDAIENSSASLIPKGSVLMVVRSGILKNKLPVAINTVDVTINQDMKAFTSKKVLAPYLLYFFISNERYMLKKVRATTADNFNFDDIRKMNINIPPLPLQNQFAAIVEKVESIKAKQTQTLAELENLYASLSQRAFKGELDLSGVEVGTERLRLMGGR